MITWGLLVGCIGATQHWAAVLSIRVLQGAAESAVTPALLLLTAAWYKVSGDVVRVGGAQLREHRPDGGALCASTNMGDSKRWNVGHHFSIDVWHCWTRASRDGWSSCMALHRSVPGAIDCAPWHWRVLRRWHTARSLIPKWQREAHGNCSHLLKQQWLWKAKYTVELASVLGYIQRSTNLHLLYHSYDQCTAKWWYDFFRQCEECKPIGTGDC